MKFWKVVCFLAIAPLNLPAAVSPTLDLRETATYINVPTIAAAGRWAAAAWDESASGQVFVSMLSPDSGWGPAQAISDQSALLQSPAAIAINVDGTAVVSWRQIPKSPAPFQSQIAVRKFVPGGGWDSIQIISTDGISPVLAFAPDGRAHIVYYDYPSFAARTLDPGSTTWSAPVVLGDANYEGPAKLVATNGVAYSAFVSGIPGPHERVYAAEYNAQGWHAATAISGADVTGSDPQLSLIGGQTMIGWTQFTTLSTDGAQFVASLRPSTPPVTVPGKACRLTTLANGSVLAVCPVQGDAVPGCFNPTRGGFVQAYYGFLRTYVKPLSGDWVDTTIISDPLRLATAPQVASDELGNAFVTWASTVPCQAGSDEVLVRTWDPRHSGWWGLREQITPGSVYNFNMAASGSGVLRSLWAVVDLQAVYSKLYTASVCAPQGNRSPVLRQPACTVASPFQ